MSFLAVECLRYHIKGSGNAAFYERQGAPGEGGPLFRASSAAAKEMRKFATFKLIENKVW